MRAPPEPELSHHERVSAARGMAQFNHGRYFECHETLEHVWSSLVGPSRDFFQALIQVSVGFHHLKRGNRAGALKTFTRALARFEPYPARYFGLDVAAERRRLQDLLKALAAEKVAGLDPPPLWRFDGLPVVEADGVVGPKEHAGEHTMTRDELFDHFKMTRHPEGGAFVENYRSDLVISPAGFSGPRSVSTGIYFLLGRNEFSAFHRIKSDEMWHFYLGGPLRIVEIDPAEGLHETTLGLDVLAGQLPSHVVKAGRWFASYPAPESEFTLVGCTVAPGFDFQDFELADRTALVRRFPQHAVIIARLTRGAPGVI